MAELPFVPVSSPLLSEAALERACRHIYLTWRKFVPESEAAAQAAEFRRRCDPLTRDFRMSEPELDQVLDAVACEMGRRVNAPLLVATVCLAGAVTLIAVGGLS